MSRVYDSWEKLIGAVLRREELRRLAYCESFSSSSISTDFSSRFSFDSSIDAHGASSRQSYNVRPIALKEVIKATKNFKITYIGEGVFCQVFKAWIDEHTLTASKPGSGMAVAVKKWNPVDRERHQDWVKEIDHIAELGHPNLVKLVAYCSEEDNMILLYEFMGNGSLAYHLFMGNGSLADHFFIRHQSLPWVTRIKVATDAARGLAFLHDREISITHRDFKTDNILLDEEFNAKLSNYWYGKDDPFGDATHISTDQVVVTDGYTAPEYTNTDHLSTSSNVYTFGVVLLELLTGVQAYNIFRPAKERYLVEWAKPYLGSKRKVLRIMDTGLEGQYPRKEAYKVAKLAYNCLLPLPEHRPRMTEVVVALEQL